MGLAKKLVSLFPGLDEQRRRYFAQRARDNAAVQAGTRRHWCIAHVWGDEETPGASMILYALGDAAAVRGETPVVVEMWQPLPINTPVVVQIAGLRQTIVRLASLEPQSALHYISLYSGFGRAGYDDLRRNGWLRGLMHQQIALTNNGPRQDDDLLWKRAKQDVIYQCASALPRITLPSRTDDRDLALLKDQLKKYRFTNTQRQPEGAFAVSDSDRDHLVLALALGVLKLQRERWRKKCYLPSSFDDPGEGGDGLRPLMQPVRLLG